MTDRQDFVDDIIEYIRASHREEGIIVYHPALKFAQPLYADPYRSKIFDEVAPIADREPAKGGLVEDPVYMQHLKSWGCRAYVDERVARGAA